LINLQYFRYITVFSLIKIKIEIIKSECKLNFEFMTPMIIINTFIRTFYNS